MSYSIENYIKDTFTLVKTMVIKSIITAKKINEAIDITSPGTYNPTDMRTWKYYINLSGMPHVSDTTIYVESVDTPGIQIEFNADVLKTHPLTRTLYDYGGLKFRELIAKYPAYETYIVGVLYPVDLDTAINADEHSILSYKPGLVEDNEETLIEELNTWLKYYMQRWTNNAYGVTDEYYTASSLAIMYQNLIPKIFNARVSRCHTREAHSFHVSSFLESHSLPGKLTSALSSQAIHWLYRNMRYIEHRQGSNLVMEDIVKNLYLVHGYMATPVRVLQEKIPGPSLKHIYLDTAIGTTSTLLESDGDSLENLITDTINSPEDVGGSNISDFYASDMVELETNIKWSRVNDHPVNIIRTDDTNLTDLGTYTFIDSLLSLWGYLSTTAVCQYAVSYPDQRTSTVIELSVSDAYTVWLYLHSKLNNGPYDIIPSGVIGPVYRPNVSPDTLRINNIPGTSASSLPESLVAGKYPLTTILTPGDFKDIVDGYHQTLLNTYQITNKLPNGQAMMVGKSMVDTLYMGIGLQLPASGSNYSEFLLSLGLDYMTGTMTDVEIRNAMDMLSVHAVGISTSHAGKWVRTKLHTDEIVKTLLSYNTQLLRRHTPVEETIVNAIPSRSLIGIDECEVIAEININVGSLNSSSSHFTQLSVNDVGGMYVHGRSRYDTYTKNPIPFMPTDTNTGNLTDLYGGGSLTLADTQTSINSGTFNP